MIFFQWALTDMPLDERLDFFPVIVPLVGAVTFFLCLGQKCSTDRLSDLNRRNQPASEQCQPGG
jgi:hypothetical protein